MAICKEYSAKAKRLGLGLEYNNPMTDTITTTAGELRRTVGADLNAPHASERLQVGDLLVTLSRSLDRWALTLHGRQPIQQDVADQWAAAVGIPQADWWQTDEDRRWRADWQEA